MLKVLRRILLIALLAVGAAYLLYQGFLFWRALDKFPPTTVVADVPVGGLTLDAAREAINELRLKQALGVVLLFASAKLMIG